MEMQAKVKTTDLNLGMGVSFEKPSRENNDKLNMALQFLQKRTNYSSDSKPDPNSNNQPGVLRTLTI